MTPTEQDEELQFCESCNCMTRGNPTCGKCGAWREAETIKNIGGQVMETIVDAKRYLRDNWEKGTDCPCCGRHVQLYDRPMHYTMVAMLIRLYRLSQKDSGYYHVKDIAAGISDTGTNDFSKLKYWGLIEQKPKDPKENKRTSGYWRITQRGIQFVAHGSTEHARVLIYDKKSLGVTGEQITIQQALGSKFDYNKLMSE